jgi:hypothetical protein
MRRQKLTGKFPTERPPDPENGSPGAVRTATGAEIQKNVLRRTTPRYLKHSAAVQSAADYDGGTHVDYDGGTHVDTVVERTGECRAYDVAPRTARLTPLQAIRQKCLWCCNGSANEIALCSAKACPSWPFRFGHKPSDEIIAEQGNTLLHPLEWRMTAAQFHAGRYSPLHAIKRKCLDCSSASKSEVRNCAFVDCALHPFRQGKNPNRAYGPEQRARRAEHLAKLKTAGALLENAVSIGDPRAKSSEAAITTATIQRNNDRGSARRSRADD